jgi:integrase/recombinase XerD
MEDDTLECPARFGILPQSKAPQRKPLTDQQLQSLLTPDYPATVQTQMLALVVRVLADTGCRIGELVRLEIGMIRMADCEADVVVKGGRVGRLQFSEATRNAITQWLKVRGRRSRVGSPSNLILTYTGRVYTPHNLGERVKEYAAKRGVKLTAHLLRHTFATRLIESGVALHAVQALMNHSAASSTMRYLHPSAATLRTAHAKLNLPVPKRHKPSVATKEDTALVTENPAAADTLGGGDILPKKNCTGQTGIGEYLTMEEALWL